MDYRNVQILHDTFDQLLILCKSVQSSTNVDKTRFNKCKWSFILGRNINAFGAKNFDYKHNIFPGKGVYMEDICKSSKPWWQIQMFHFSKRLIEIVDKEFVGNHMDYCLMVSKMIKTSSESSKDQNAMFTHRDKLDISHQYSFTIGNYSGGNLVCMNMDGKQITVNNKGRIIRFDGRLPHKVEAVTEGETYTFLSYKKFDRKIGSNKMLFLPTPQYMDMDGTFRNIMND